MFDFIIFISITFKKIYIYISIDLFIFVLRIYLFIYYLKRFFSNRADDLPCRVTNTFCIFRKRF